MKKDDKSYFSDLFKNIAGLVQKNKFLRNSKKLFYFIDSIILSTIKKPIYKPTQKKNVLVIFNIALGDGVIFRCTSIHLRKVFPKKQYNLILACQKGLNSIYEKDNVFDSIIPIDFNSGTLNLKQRRNNYKILRKIYYDIVIDPVGISDWTTNIFATRACISKEKVGYIDIDENCKCDMKKLNKIYTNIIKINGYNVSLVDLYATFFNKYAGKELIKPGLEKLIIKNNDKLDLPKEYFIVFPSASLKLKRWSIDKYVEITNKIYDKIKIPLVIVGTKADEESLDLFKEKLNIPFIDLVNKTSLNDYFNIIRNSSLLVTNDTSAYHIGVMEEVPTVIITGGYTDFRYSQYNFKRKDEFKRPCVVVYPMDCFNCNNWCSKLKSTDENWPCLEAISSDYAWDKIEKYIDDRKKEK